MQWLNSPITPRDNIDCWDECYSKNSCSKQCPPDLCLIYLWCTSKNNPCYGFNCGIDFS